MSSGPHRRYNPLRQEWVLVSPHRADRPWQGQIDPPPRVTADRYDANCYLCPGNVRAHGRRNPEYASTFAFDNDFPALGIDVPSPGSNPEPGHELLQSMPERGFCRVICFSPRHDLTLSRMDVTAVRGIVDAWAEECDAVASHPWVRYALVFENRGDMMGASNAHPHCQLWATEHVPTDPARERLAFTTYRERHPAGCLLCDYLRQEMDRRERIVCENDGFVAIVPFWAVWPFETIVIARQHVGLLSAFDSTSRDRLADVLRQLTGLYDALFAAPFPYSMGVHQAPMNDATTDAWHLHLHFYPPLLRSATIRKFVVGFELLGEPQRDLTPEAAAARLREAARD